MNLPNDYLEQVRVEYPRRMGHNRWEEVRTLIPRLVGVWGISWETVLKGTRNYKLMCARGGKEGSEFVMPANKFYSDRDRVILEYAEMDLRTPAEVAAVERMTSALARAELLGFRRPGATETPEQYESSLKDFERSKSTGLGAPKFQVVR